MLKINGLTKNFKKVKAIDNFSFEFKNGVYNPYTFQITVEDIQYIQDIFYLY